MRRIFWAGLRVLHSHDGTRRRGGREQHREDDMSMKRNENKSGWSRILSTTVLCACAWLGTAATVSAQTMSDYTNMPLFINKSAPPNILFLVDIGNYTLEAAYAGSGHYYPISYKNTVNTVDASNNHYYASNVTVDTAAASGGGVEDTDLRALDMTNTVLPGATIAAPADTFDRSEEHTSELQSRFGISYA